MGGGRGSGELTGRAFCGSSSLCQGRIFVVVETFSVCSAIVVRATELSLLFPTGTVGTWCGRQPSHRTLM